MFTGLVECIGKVLDIQKLDTSADGGHGCSLTIGQCHSILHDCHIGDSISINGTCLTVTNFDSDSFKVNLAPETLRKTNLGLLSVNAAVNLERAVSTNTRFGGHYVQGHVDTIATIKEIQKEENSIWYTLQFTESDQQLTSYIIPKGYIALDGTSLTVCEVNDTERCFSIMLIPHTQTHVIMPLKAVGDSVNVEVDMLAKYVHKMLHSSLLDGSDSNYITRVVEEVLAKQKSS